MTTLASFSAWLCVWLAGSVVWAAVMNAIASRAVDRYQDWPSYWLAWLVAAVAPALAAPLFAFMPAPATSLQIDAALAIADLTAPLQRASGSPNTALPWLAVAGMALFFAGLLRSAIRYAAGLRGVRSIIRASQPASVETQNAVLILTTSRNTPVFCVGGARPAIVFPRALLNSMSSEQIALVIGHELAHVRRRDPLLFAALEAVKVLFWFNPFVHVLTERARLAAEISCDRIALAGGGERKLYAEAMLKALDNGADISSRAVATFGARRHASQTRLAHILRGVRRKHRGLASVTLIALSLMTSTTGAATAATTARLSTFGDSGMLSALSNRLVDLYGTTRCQADSRAE